MNRTTIIATLLSGLISGLVVATFAFHLDSKHDERELKRDVLRRFVGNRYLLTELRMGHQGEPFVALNEAFIAYADHPEVISALRKMHEQLGVPNRLSDNILTLTKEMAKAAEVNIRTLNDDFITRPFTPPRVQSEGS